MFRRRKKVEVPPTPVVPDDIDQARAVRARASVAHRDALREGFAVTQLAAALVERRSLNHFGDSIQITFTRRA